jgi:hypothetical protein
MKEDEEKEKQEDAMRLAGAATGAATIGTASLWSGVLHVGLSEEKV